MATRTGRRGHKDLERKLSLMERRVGEVLGRQLSRIRTTSAQASVEFMDLVVDSEADDMASRLAEANAMDLEEIDEALDMLREGTYGSCRGCSEKIASARLTARPFSTLCIRCKQQAERSGGTAVFGGHDAEWAEADVGLGGDRWHRDMTLSDVEMSMG